MKKISLSLLSILILISGCSTINNKELVEDELKKYDKTYDSEKYSIRKIKVENRSFLNAIDISMQDIIEENGGKYYDENLQEMDFYRLIKKHNINAVRIRLFNDYTSPTGANGAGKQDKERVLKMAKKAKKQNLKFILDLHYSDTWADPGQQTVPYAWKDLSFEEVNEAMYQYTYDILKYFKKNGAKVDYIQVGNEINNGMMWPFGQIDWTNDNTTNDGFNRFTTLIKSGVKAVRDYDKSTKIILHCASALENVYGKPYHGIYFFEKMRDYNVDYDIMGASYYINITETKVNTISSSIDELTKTFNKDFFLMEYSYGFTTLEHPYADNVLWEGDAKNSGYPLTIQGQTDYITDIIEQVGKNKRSIGTCYWGGEWIPVKGAGWLGEDTKSSWANQALFTYDGMALPSLNVYKNI